MAAENSSFIAEVLRIKNPVHRRKLQLKALDLVLFGLAEPATTLKDVALAVLAASFVGLAVVFFSHRKRSHKQLEELSTQLGELNTMERNFGAENTEDVEEVGYRMPLRAGLCAFCCGLHSEHCLCMLCYCASLPQSPHYSPGPVFQLQNKLREMEQQLDARSSYDPSSMLSDLQPLLRITYERELCYIQLSKGACLEEMKEAREYVDKLRKKQSNLFNSIKLATGATSGTDSIDFKIFKLK